MEEIFRKSDFYYDPPSGACGTGFHIMNPLFDFYDPPLQFFSPYTVEPLISGHAL